MQDARTQDGCRMLDAGCRMLAWRQLGSEENLQCEDASRNGSRRHARWWKKQPGRVAGSSHHGEMRGLKKKKKN